MSRLEVHYLNGGHCRHLLAAVDGRSLRFVTFHAVFLAIRHPRLDWVVCDTGYGTRFFEATKRWPFRLYRWATPVSLRGSTSETLHSLGIKASEVRHLIITHFHADHIGGLQEFTNAQVYYHEDALRPLQALKASLQTRAAFLPSLVPTDLSDRSRQVRRDLFAVNDRLPFQTYDLFGDGLLNLVELPGHAPGHLGLEYEGSNGRTLYCADAFWRSEQIGSGVDLPRPILGLQWDGAAYKHTVEKLRQLERSKSHLLLACHDAETQRYVADD